MKGMVFMVKKGKGFTYALVTAMLLSGFSFPSIAGAAVSGHVYWSGAGVLHPGESIHSGKVFLPKGTKVLEITQIASGRDGEDPWQGSFEIKLLNRRGQVVDSCLGDNYNFQTTGECYLEGVKTGIHEVQITNLSSPEMNVLSAKLRD
ncbi:hypothetical protein EDC32_101352 [Laceyella sacchari]|nr:hypothetical protein EDC32_101352 [Laceyella sacchari]